MQEISNLVDTIFTIMFTVEFFIKSVALGFWLEKGTYLKDNWNKLDFIILLLSLVDLTTTSINFQIVKVFRVLRILRPLKLIRYNPSMRIILVALVKSLYASINIIAIISVIWIVFAVLGVSLFNGKLYSCQNSAFVTLIECENNGFR